MANETRAVIQTATRTEGDQLVLVLSGAAESDSMDPLAAAVARADAQARAANATTIVADLVELEFMTSSCLKVLATWIVEMPSPAPYQIVFRSNPAHSWQRRSLRALTMCAPELARIEERRA